MKDLALHRTSLFVALALITPACGDDGGTGASASASASSTGSTGSGTDTTTNPTMASSTTGEPTTGGSMSQTDSASSSGTSTTDGTGTSTTDPTTDPTTEGVMTTTDGTSTTTTTTTDGTTTTTTTDGTGSTTDEPPAQCACPDLEVPLDDGIFVLSDNAQLWKYRPDSNDFQMLGSFNCGGVTTMFSMAVDRLGFAWVMRNDGVGDIWKIDVTQPQNCTDPGYNPGQMGVGFYGMAFVSNSKFDQCDRLYGNTFDGVGSFSEGPNFGDFITLDPQTLQVSIIGPTNFNGAEMTGTGDGRVFSFGGVPSKLVERDKVTGAVLSTLPLNNLPLTNAFAFAFFAGDFYFFTESDVDDSVSKVTKLDYDGDQQLTTVNPQGPIRIVGAGVSTCAPVVPM